MHRYKCWNGPAPTIAAQQQVTTGTAIKTMLQIATPSTRMIQLVSWGFSVDDPPGADATFELLETDVAATGLTAHVAAGVQPVWPGLPASLMTLSTSGTGYASTAPTEGTITATRVFDVVSMSSVSAEAAPVMQYAFQFLEAERPIINVSKFLRVRATTPTTAVDMRCWVCWDE
jgi:hypothetical protein